jgi:transcriptional regulator of aromatic amino acid metabolism
MKLFVHNLYFFDDGMASIENYQIAKKNNQTVNFTTIFDLKKTKTINIEKLDYSFKNIEIQDDSKVYIIGSALDFNNVISRSDYVNVIRYICDIFKDKHVEFFPHRHESEELLEEVNRFVHITTPNVDFESYINMTNVNPRRIIGFNSTLMYILSRYYGCNVLSIDITECIEGMRKKEEFEITYKYFSDVGGIDVFKYHN